LPQYLAGLEKLAKAPGNTQAMINQINQTIREGQLGQLAPFGMSAGQVQLAPGNIRMPTAIDVMRGVGGPRPHGLVHTHMITAQNTQHSNNTINVYVHSAADASHVYDAIAQATGSQLGAQARAAGLV
jgi:hypothetical protein